jgi:hypothetical protein
MPRNSSVSEECRFACCLLHADFLLRLILKPVDLYEMFFGNVCCLLTGTVSRKMEVSTTTDVMTSNTLMVRVYKCNESTESVRVECRTGSELLGMTD